MGASEQTLNNYSQLSYLLGKPQIITDDFGGMYVNFSKCGTVFRSLDLINEQ